MSADKVAQGLVQPGFENLPGQRSQRLSEQVILMLDCPHDYFFISGTYREQ